MSGESTSSSESEEDDGDSDDDEPDVLGPTGLTQDTDTTITSESSSSKKRAFDDADLTLTLDDFCNGNDDADFPRKRISLDMSPSLMPSCNASTVGDTEDDYAGLDLLDDDGMDGLLGDEEELENEEVAAIIQEIEQQDKDSPNSFLLDSEDLAQFELAEDLNSELFSAEWESSNLLFNHITSDNDIDLFNVHLTTAESTPAATPKDSDFSSAFPPATPLDSCTDNNDISSEDDIFDFNALFDRPSKQIAAYASNMASLSDIDIDSDDAELAKYFFSSEDSGNETDREDDSDDGMSMCFSFLFSQHLRSYSMQRTMTKGIPPKKRMISPCRLPDTNLSSAASPFLQPLLSALKSFVWMLPLLASKHRHGLQILQGRSLSSRTTGKP